MSEPLPTMYLVDAEMPSQVGPVAALMYSILMAHEVDGITQMSHKRLAEITGISHSTVKRNLDKLRGRAAEVRVPAPGKRRGC